jgi:hypothetical protein
MNYEVNGIYTLRINSIIKYLPVFYSCTPKRFRIQYNFLQKRTARRRKVKSLKTIIKGTVPRKSVCKSKEPVLHRDPPVCTISNTFSWDCPFKKENKLC